MVAQVQTLESAAPHTDNVAVLTDLDPELHGLPIGIPVGVLGGRTLGYDASRAILLKDAIGPENPYLEEGWVR